MRDMEELVKNLYSKDEYIARHPSLHAEDSPWKISKIIPIVDSFAGHVSKKEINLLDVGGGAGLILKAIATHLEESHALKVNKFALDLSPGILELQQKINPDLKKAQ